MDIQEKLKITRAQITELFKKVEGGDTGKVEDLNKLMKLERTLVGEQEPEGGAPEEDPVLERLKVKKRKYTLSDIALAARRNNAQLSTGPKTEAGKAASARNNWRHGMYAESRILGLGKPCKSTCPKFPCSLVDEGAVEPGGDCSDKEHLVKACKAIERALKDGSLDDLKDITTLHMAETLQVIGDLQGAILEFGPYMKSEKMDKDGKVIGYELKPNPALLPLSNLIKAFGLTMPEFMITPAAVERKKSDDKAVETIADIFRVAGAALALAKEKKEGK